MKEYFMSVCPSVCLYDWVKQFLTQLQYLKKIKDFQFRRITRTKAQESLRYAYISLLTTLCIHFITHYAMHTCHYSLRYAYMSLLTTLCIHVITHYAMHTFHYSLRYAYISLLTTLCIHFITHYAMHTFH
jgi:hypothetical protein